MWKQQKLKLSPQAKTALENNAKGINSPLSLSAQGIKIGVHNWSHGIKEKSNHYLSPENAAKAFATKLTDYADPNRPKGEMDLVAIMVTSNDIDTFINELEKVRQLLPEPTFKQALDYAKSSKTLQESKMVKTPTIASPAFGNVADITPGSNRIMQSILRNANSAANANSGGDPVAMLKRLAEIKQARQQKNQEQVQQLLAINANVWAFSLHGSLEFASTQIMLNLPNASNVFTACVLFIGENLSSIQGMLAYE